MFPVRGAIVKVIFQIRRKQSIDFQTQLHICTPGAGDMQCPSSSSYCESGRSGWKRAPGMLKDARVFLTQQARTQACAAVASVPLLSILLQTLHSSKGLISLSLKTF